MAEWKLTREGRIYLKQGLPEVVLMQILKRPLPIAKAQKEMDNFKIALQWTKKHGWVKIEKGMLIPVKPSAKPPEQAALEAIGKGRTPPEPQLQILIKRNLVKKESEDLRKVKSLAGKEINELTPGLLKTGLWRNVKLKPYNVIAGGSKVYPGKRHPYSRFLKLTRRKLTELGFKEMVSPTIETEFWNFDAMYQAQNHPSRDWTQTYSLKHPKEGGLPKPSVVNSVKAAHENGGKTGSTGWGYKWDPKKAAQLMPRAHGTACSARQLADNPKIPGKYFAISRCYRPDVIDATHGVEFNQCEGIVIGKDMNFKNLLGILKQFAIEVAGTKEVKFLPDYYPFTEPSVQLSAKHPKMGWIEFAGAGIFRPEFTESLGIKEPVLAWGLGIDRLAMFRLGVKDIRYLFSQDLDWIRKKEVIW
jgi:phenylalanyl-tRNA synthetase alpha chain